MHLLKCGSGLPSCRHSSVFAMADIANRDAAEQSLDIAKAALAANNLIKAQKFVEKAMKLYPSDEVQHFVCQKSFKQVYADIHAWMIIATSACLYVMHVPAWT